MQKHSIITYNEKSIYQASSICQAVVDKSFGQNTERLSERLWINGDLIDIFNIRSGRNFQLLQFLTDI